MELASKASDSVIADGTTNHHARERERVGLLDAGSNFEGPSASILTDPWLSSISISISMLQLAWNHGDSMVPEREAGDLSQSGSSCSRGFGGLRLFAEARDGTTTFLDEPEAA